MQGSYHEILVNNWGQHQIETGTIADRYLIKSLLPCNSDIFLTYTSKGIIDFTGPNCHSGFQQQKYRERSHEPYA